jgi:hypothetical protein
MLAGKDQIIVIIIDFQKDKIKDPADPGNCQICEKLA